MPLRPKMTLQEFGEIFLRRKWIVVFVVTIIFFIASVYCVVTPEMYRSSTAILIIPQSIPREYVRSTVSFRAEQQLATIRQQVLSRTALLKVMEATGAFAQQRTAMTTEDVLALARKRIEIDVSRNHGGNEAFAISFEYEDPRVAMRVADRLAYVFIEENLKTRERQAVGTSEFLDSQLKDTKARLEQLEERVRNYKIRHMGELPQQMDANLRVLAGLQDRLRTNENAIRGAEERQVFLEAQIGVVGKSLPAAPAGSSKEAASGKPLSTGALESELFRKRQRLAELEAKYTEAVPEVARTKSEVEDLERRLARARQTVASAHSEEGHSAVSEEGGSGTLEQLRQLRARQRAVVAEIASLKKERDETLRSIAGIERKVGASPLREQEMTALIRDYENQKKSYDDLLSKKLEADVSQNLEKRQKGTQFQILDPANLPEEPFRPNRRKVMGGALLGSLALAFALVLAIEGTDQRLRDVGDFRHLYKVKILGCVPALQDDRKLRLEALHRAAILWGLVAMTTAFSLFLLFFRKKILSILNL